MVSITSVSGKQYDIPSFLTMTYLEYKLLIVQYQATAKPDPKPKPKPKSRDTYYE